MTADLPAGTHTMRVEYSGDSRFAATTGTATQVVTSPPVNVAFATTPAAPVAGAATTLTATVTAAAGPPKPTGTVYFSDGNTYLGATNVNGTTGVASLSVALSAGVHAISAEYGGDSIYFDTRALSTVTATQASTSLALTSSKNPTTSDGAVATYTATITATGTPTGTIYFYSDGTYVGAATVASKKGTFVDHPVAGKHVSRRCTPATPPSRAPVRR